MEKEALEIMHVLDRIYSYAPLGYISLHSNVADPLPILEGLERMGYLSRCRDCYWSPSPYPLFMITPDGRSALRQFRTVEVQVPRKLVAQKMGSR